MRAARIHAFGEPLSIDDVDEPVVPSDEVLFEAVAIGVNPLDVWLTDGSVAGGRQTLPFIPGSEATGLIDGRRVLVRGHGLGVARDGLYRERASVPPTAAVTVPEGLELDAAACLGIAGGTAWRLVHDVGAVTAADRVLVLGASGGVGSLAVQLAKTAGAVVWGQTTDPSKAAFVESLGVHRCVLAGAEDLVAAIADLAPTVAIDPLAGRFTPALVFAMAPFGRIVLYGASAGPTAEFDLRALYRKALAIRTYSGTLEPDDRNHEAMSRAMEAAARGELSVFIDEVLPLERAAEAHARIRERRVRGKLLLRP